MKRVDNFYNKVLTGIDSTYFPKVTYYRDNKHTEKIHYDCELFNNGCISLQDLINRVAKQTKDTEENITNLILKYIEE
jgi:hypothetical protein